MERKEAAQRVIAAHAAVSRWWARDFKRRNGPAGLTSTQLSILSLAGRLPGINVSHLAERLELSVPTVVRAVDALERKGLVERRRGSADGREVVVAPTPEGTALRAEVERMRVDRLARLLGGMADGDVAGLVNGYEAMARAAAGTDAAIERIS